MTVLVGVKCTDGVVVGADSMATSTHGPAHLLQTPTDKIQIIGEKVIIAGSGSVGLGQRFGHVVQTLWGTNHFQSKLWDCLRGISAHAISDFRSTDVPFLGPPNGFGFGALLAAPIEDRAHLVEYGIADLQPELKDGKLTFVAMGSGQMLAEPFVAFVRRVWWANAVPDVKTAMFGVYWALDHTIKFAPGGVGEPIKIATLRREKGQWRARLLDDDELQEQAQHIEKIEERIAQDPKRSLEESVATAPPPPPPKAG